MNLVYAVLIMFNANGTDLTIGAQPVILAAECFAARAAFDPSTLPPGYEGQMLCWTREAVAKTVNEYRCTVRSIDADGAVEYACKGRK